ncbi:MAG: T9SS type A sorting domain-containing protein [Rhodothermales bacterium]|nr:T9SS type A sorting domain-containing protein [Rhodothermales bacterium]
MRTVALIFSLGIAVSATAQDVIPDTLDARRYHPLEVRNEWHWTTTDFLFPVPSYERATVVGDTIANNRKYFVCVREFFDASFTLVRTFRSYLRYNAVGAVLSFDDIALDPLEPDSTRPWYHADFGDTLDVVPRQRAVVDGRYDTTFAGQRIAAIKTLWIELWDGSFFEAEAYAADVGLISRDVFDGPTTALGYANVGGLTFGSPIVNVGRSETVLPARRSGVSVYPNPTGHRTTIAVDMVEPQRVTLEVIDLLGRSVSLISFGPGSHKVSLDAASLPAGVYFVRLMAGDRVETRSLVVAR